MTEIEKNRVEKLLKRWEEPEDSKMLFYLRTEDDVVIAMQRKDGKIIIYQTYGDEVQFFEEDIEFDGFEFDAGIEGMIMIYMENRFEIEFMDLSIHCRIWTFLNQFEYNVEQVYHGVRAYLLFCMKKGINHICLSYLNGSEIEDVYDKLYDFRFNDFTILYYNIMDRKRYMIGYRILKDGILQYGVFITDDFVENVTYYELFSYENDAFRTYVQLTDKIYEYRKIAVQNEIECTMTNFLDSMEDTKDEISK